MSGLMEGRKTRKDPTELRWRTVRMAIDARTDPQIRTGAYKRIGEQLGEHSWKRGGDPCGREDSASIAPSTVWIS